jgi:hypothetical protein
VVALAAAAAATVSGAIPHIAGAASNDTWVGTTDANWATSTDWSYSSGSGPVSTGDSLFFNTATTTALTNNLTTGINLNSITFNSGASAFTVGGTSSVTLTNGITNSGTSLETLNFPFAQTTVQTITTTAGGGNITLGGVISGTGGGIKAAGGGILTLSGANTFTGGLAITSGTVVANISNATTVSGAAGPSGDAITLGSSTGASSNLLANSFTVANAITLGAGATTAGFTQTIGNNGAATASVFSGAINLNGDALTIAATGTGSATISGGITGTGALTLSNAGTTSAIALSTTAINNVGTITNTGASTGKTTINSVISTSVTGVIENSSSSSLVLTNANTYTSATSVTSGTLILAPAAGVNAVASLADTAITVSSGGTFNPQTGAGMSLTAGNTTTTTAGATLTLNGGGAFSMAGSNIGTFNLVEGATDSAASLNLNSTTTAPTLTFEVSPLGADKLVLTKGTGGGAVTNSGSTAAAINVVYASGANYVNPGNYTIITGGSGLGTTANLTLGTTSIAGPAGLPGGAITYNLSLANSTATSEILTVTGSNAAGSPTTAYWNSTTNGSWSYVGSGPSTNWVTAATSGTDTGAVPGSVTNVFFSASALGSGATQSTTLDGAYAINSLTFTGSGIDSTSGATIAPGTGGSLSVLGGITVASGAASPTISAPVTLVEPQTWTVATGSTLNISGAVAFGTNTLTTSGAGNVSISGAITGTGGLTQSSTGTTTLANGAGYSGTTTIVTGALALTTVSPTLSGNVLFGGVTGTNPYVAPTTTGALSIGSGINATINGNVTVQTNSSTPNTITIPTGSTLTVLGNFTVGYDLGSLGNTSNTATTELTASGGGTLAILNTASTVNVGIAEGIPGGGLTFYGTPTSNYLNVSALGSFVANVGTFNVGFSTTNNGTLTLSNTANAITATTLNIGNSNGNNGGTGFVTLGTGTNVIDASTLNIGLSKVNGTLQFASQGTGPGTAAGTVFIANAAGTSGAAITIGSNNGTATGGVPTGLVNLDGHNATVLASTLTIGYGNNASTGGAIGTLDFDTGTFNVSGAVILGYRSTATSTSSSAGSGTINLNGGTFTVASSAGSITLATNTSTATFGSATGIINITGGVFNSNVSILKGGGTGGNTTATITLNGGTLNMAGNAIGSTATPIDNLNFQSGTLQNVGTLNGTAGLTKTTTGTLTMTGTSAYTGVTAVNAGTLTAHTTSDATSGLSVLATGTFNYASTATTPVPFTLGGTTTTTLSLVSGATLGATIGSTTSNGELLLSSSGSATTAGTITVNVMGDSGVTSLPNGTYTLISSPHGGLVSGNGSSGSYTLGTVFNATNFQVTPGSLSQSDTAVTIGVTPISALANEYWNGGFSGGANVWAASDGSGNSNWSSTQAGYTATSQTPGSATTVTFSDTAPVGEGSMTLGAPVAVLGLVSNDPAALVLNNEANSDPLTIGTGGISVNSGAGAVTINAPVILAGAQTWANSTTSNTLSATNGVATSGYTLTLAGAVALSGVSGTGNLAVSTGTTTLSGTNSYSGTTTVSSGATFALTGSLTGGTAITTSGTFTESTAGSITGGTALTVSAGTATVGGANGYTGATTVNSGGTLLLTGTLGSAGGTAISSAGTFTEPGTGVIAGTSSLTISGATTTLNGLNTYTGATSINGGSLTLKANGTVGATLGATAVAITGGTLSVTPGVATTSNNSLGGSLTFNAGAALTMADGFTNTFKVTGASVFSPATGAAPTLTFDIGGSSGLTNDLLVIGGAASYGAVSPIVYFNAVGGQSLSTSQQYTFITAASGLVNASFTLGTPRLYANGLDYSLALGGTGTTEYVTLTALPAAFYTGNAGSGALNATSGSTTNWSSSQSGSPDLGGQPTSTQDVYFAATSVSTPQTINSLGQAYTFNTLDFTPGAAAITLNNGGSANALTLTAGVTDLSANAQIINVPVVAGGAQTITNSNTTPALLSFTDGFTAGANLLTIAGNGPVTIGGSAAFTSSVGFSVNSGAGAFTINAPVTVGASQNWTNNSTSAVNVGGAIALGGNTLTVAGSGNTIISGLISGTGGLTMAAGNNATLTFSNSGNAYTGATTINSGTVALGANNGISTASAVTIGTGTLTTFQTANLTFNLNGYNQSLASLTAPTYSAANTVLDTIVVSPGNTLTLTGNLSLGLNTAAATPTEIGYSHMIIGGGGSLVTTGTATWQIGNDNQSVGGGAGPGETATLDLTGLGTVNINLGATGTLTISNPQPGNETGSQASLLLPNPSNVPNTVPITTIAAGTVSVGVGSGNNGSTGQINTLVLGSGLTTLDTNTLNIGASANRDLGSLAFTGTGGDITLRADNGTSAAAVNIGTGAATTGVGSGAGLGNVFDVSGHYADLLISTLDIGNQARTANLTSTFKFDTGLLNATGIAVGYHSGTNTNTAVNTNIVDLGYNSAWSDSGISTTPVGTVIVGTGGLEIGNSSYAAAGASQEVATVNIGTGETVTIANSATLGGAIRLATNSATSGAGFVTATLNIQGGSLTVAGNIIAGAIATGGTGTNTSTLTLNGGSLNMSGNNIGTAAAPITSLNFQSGTLQNVGTINGTAGLTKSTTGTLLLTGTAAYTGATTVSGGTLTAQTTSDATSSLSVLGTAAFNYASTAATPGGFSLNGAGGNTLTLVAGSTIGATIGTTLTNGAISLSPAATALTTGAITVNVEGDSAVSPGTGTYTLISAPGGGLSSTNGSTASYTLGTIYNATNFTVSGSLIVSDTAIQIGIIGTASQLANEYWNGGFSGGANVWSASDGVANSNWSTSQTGYSATSQTPGAATTVTFSDTAPATPSGEGNMTLGAPVSVLGLVSNDPAALVLNFDSVNNTLTMGTGGITLNSGAGSVTLNVPVILSGSQNWANSTTSGTLSATNGVATAGFTLTTAGLTSIGGGITGGGNLIVSSGQTTLSGGTSTIATVSIGSGGAAALYQASGAKLTLSAAAAGTDLPIGSATSGYGYYSVAGGSLTTNEADIGAGAGSTGVLDLSVNSALVDPGFLKVAVGTGATGELNVSGTTTVTLAGTTGTSPKFGLNWAAGNTAVVNLNSGTITGPATGTTYTLDFNAAGGNSTSIVNLNGGTLQIGGLIATTASTSPMQLNFNGGTLKATVANAGFFGNVLTGNTASGAYVYGNGGTIDNNGVNITVAQVIKSPTANGVTALALPSGDSGYIAPPLVTISGGGGTGATAIANVSGGVVTSFTITNPGTGYTSTPTYALSGGGGTAGTAGAVTTAANSTGNVIYTDSSATNSTTTISGANTYTGNTYVTGAALVNATTATAFGSGTVFLNSTSDNAGVVLSFTPTAAITVNNPISVVNITTGRQNIASNAFNVTITNPISIAAGTGAGGALTIYNNTSATTFTLNGGFTGTGYSGELSLRPAGSIVVAAPINLAAAAVVDLNVGVGSVTFNGASNASTWGGTEFLETGTTAVLGNTNTLPATTFLYGNGGATLDMEGYSQAVTGLQANLLKITNNNATAGNPSTLTDNIGATTNAFTGSMADGSKNTVALVLNGTTGTQSIGFTNFTGGITVNGGTLSVNANSNANAAMVAGTNALANPINPADTVTLSGGTLQLEGRNQPTTTTLTGQTLSNANNSTTQIGLTSAAGLVVGQGVTDSTVGADIPAGSYIVAIAGNTIYLNNAIPNAATGQTLNFTAATTSTTAQTLNNLNVSAASTLDVESNTSGGGTTLTIGAMTGSGNLTAIGNSTVLIGGNNPTFTGGLKLTGTGTVQMNAATALSASNAVTVGTGATFDLNGYSQTIAGLSDVSGVGGTVTNSGAAGTLTLGGSGATSFGGVIAGGANISLTVSLTGGGTQTITGGNTYSGQTSINAGTFLANTTGATNSATGSGNVVVSASGTLAGTGNILLGTGNSVSIAAPATLSPGPVNGVGSLSIAAASTPANAVTLADGSNFDVYLTHSGFSNLNVTTGTVVLTDGANGGPNLVLSQNGSLAGGESFIILYDPTSVTGTFAGGTLTGLETYTGISNSIAYTLTYDTGPSLQDVTLTINSVPEPGSVGIAAAGALGLLARRRRRRSSRK